MPLLFWFCLLFVLLYKILFFQIITFIYLTLKTRAYLLVQSCEQVQNASYYWKAIKAVLRGSKKNLFSFIMGLQHIAFLQHNKTKFIALIFFSPLEQFDVVFYVTRYMPIPLANVLFPLVLIIFIFLVNYSIGLQTLKLIPTPIQKIFELAVEFIFDLIRQQIGKDGYIYFPFFFTIFYFILLSNILSLMPFGIALTSHIIMIVWLSLSVCSSIFLIGLIHHKVQFLKIFLPESPFILLPMLIFIEIFSYIIRAFSLAIRLSANIMAGHTLVFIITSFVFELTLMKQSLFILGLFLIMPILILELGVAFLQAYVFTVLVNIYLKDALHGGH